MQIFAGSSNQPLAKKIAKTTKSTFGKIDLSRFSNGEARVFVQEKRVKEKVAVVQSLSLPTDEHLIEYVLLCDALARMGAQDITAVMPWIGYSLQDKVFRKGEPLSAKAVAQIIQVSKAKRVITLDLHNRAILGFFDIPVIDLSARSLFIKYFRRSVNKKTFVVAPDEGAVKNSTSFAMDLGASIVYMDKKRNLTSGKVDIIGMSRSVKGNDIIIIDDIISTGSTLIETAKALKHAGARSIRVAVTHHLHVPGVQGKLDKSPIDVFVTTDTIANNNKSPKLVVLSVADLIGEELRY
jgi:ribose-phosphate pyrophosphokinase